MNTDAIGQRALGRSALGKVSWRVLPLIGLGYGVAYMDRVNISFAAARMNADLHFSAAIYGLGGGLFFLSYALFEVPSNLLLARFGARRWLARIMFTWGILAMAMMLVRTPLQFYAVRFGLGLAEAGFFPGVVYYLGHWFPAAQRARAISRFYIAWPLSTVVMGALAGALLGLNGRLGLTGWQWLFLAEGLPSVLLSAVVLTRLPDAPQTARWLTPDEAGWIAGALAADAAAVPPAAHHDVWRILASPPVLILGAANALMLGASYAFNLSAPQLLDAATHLGPTRVGWLIAAAGLVGAAAMLANSWRSDVTGERNLHTAVPLLGVAAALALFALVHAPWAAMTGFVGFIGFQAAAAAVLWLVVAQRLPAAHAAAGLAAINCLGQLGSFFASWSWGVARDATGGYQAGLLVLPLAFAGSAAIFAVDKLRRQAV
ncbi:MAG TPA: MFS transporter [Caulobacteraceae bacterium]|jgi:ACS family tartrate transporter-like MFS transporter|nr:MFS transporter [Caulobacteraceae bacterium]